MEGLAPCTYIHMIRPVSVHSDTQQLYFYGSIYQVVSDKSSSFCLLNYLYVNLEDGLEILVSRVTLHATKDPCCHHQPLPLWLY